ncbi:DUF1640 domain-containing protein [Candidatus Magnetominusculus dajiuhuensis]|uniref:DUF1640 domain-containing protein n=1 Tax=Candidatus Magnetominusculus dajiuhuensis TaxID=3137712 RepID=UPI003B4343AB
MAAVLFDTLRVVESLKSSGFSDEQAKGLSEALKVAQETSTEGFATAVGLEKVRLELKADMESSKSDIIKWVAAMLVAQAALIAGMFRLLGLLK